MQKKLFRFISMVLALVIVFNMLPVSTLAAEADVQTRKSTIDPEEIWTETTETVEEVVERRGEFSKQYKLNNGLYVAALFADPVHYEKDGQWKEIDNTLKSVGLGSKAAFTNTEGVWEVSFPQELTKDNRITITKDGYTLSFGMSGQLNHSSNLEVARSSELTTTQTNSAETFSVGTQKFSVQSAQASKAQIQSPDLSQLKESAVHEKLVNEKLGSRLTYGNVYSNTNVTYDLKSNRVKESIILEQYDSTLRGYKYTLEVGSMIPVLEESGQILFYDESKQNVVMAMPAPFLIDDALKSSYDIDVQLSGSGSTYTLSYILPQQWLADSERQWPVVLDPVILADIRTQNINDASVTENTTYGALNPILECGYGKVDGVQRSYLEYLALPTLTSADVIISASLQLYKPVTSGTTASVEIHKVLSTWTSNSITWANKPAFNPIIEDFNIVQNQGYYTWDITDVVRGWYEGENTGLMLKTNDEVEAAKTNNWKQFYSSDYSDYPTYMPTMAIYFRNNNGLESYWDYTVSSAGRAGTGYVNNYTGNLTWIRNDIGFGGNRMPVSISHIYNANDSAQNSFGLGLGWRTNFNQRVYQWQENSAYYVWEDSDGTKHYFTTKDGIIQDEDGMELTLTVSNGACTITDKYGNKSYFDTKGRLIKQSNNQATPSNIIITYTDTTGYKISTIKDGAGRLYSFTYNSSGLLSRISYKGSGSNEITYVAFTYSGNKLTKITDKDGKYSTYTYSSNLLTQALDIDGYKLQYSYNIISGSTDEYRPSRVVEIKEYDGSVARGHLAIEYAHNQTTFTDKVNNTVQIDQFNNFGNTVSTQDGEGRAQFAQYAFNTNAESDSNTDATKKGNQLRLASKLQNTVGNVLKDSSFESSTTWTVVSGSGSQTISTSQAYYGGKSLAVTNALQVKSSTFTVAAGATYTFSAYIKTSGTTAKLQLTNGTTTKSSSAVSTGGAWQRMEVSYTNSSTSSVTLTARLITSGTGTTYMDCVQVEKAATASRYNLIENGDFRHGEYGWTRGTHFASTEKSISATAAATELDNKVYSITGSPTLPKHLYQKVQVSGSAGDTLVLAGWAKGDSAPLTSHDSNTRQFGLVAIFNNTDGTQTTQVVQFNPDTNSTGNWQYVAGVAVAKKAYSSVNIDVRYDYNVNTVFFDGIQLYKEAFGNSYTYDSKGNVVSVVDLQKQKTSYVYSNNNLTKETLPTGAVLTYTYDNYHNVKTATTDTGVVYNFTYDTYGNNTVVSIGSGTTKLQTSATYSNSGNTLATTTDAAGKVTTYTYNANTNVLESVKYPKDSDTSKTNYTYDSMYRLATASAAVTGLSEGSALTATYSYTDDQLASIQTGSTKYSFAYGNFGLRTSVKIGTRTLASYYYNDEPVNDQNKDLDRLVYGNNDMIQYTYDKYGRVTKETYEDGDTVSYQYGNNGALATVTDSATGITTTYYYDFTDRLMKYVESGTNYSHSVGYEYDNINNLTKLVETINGVAHTSTYTYDDDNRIVSKTTDGIGSTYTYDAYGRISGQTVSNNGSNVMTKALTYRNPTSALTSGQIATYSTTIGGSTYAYSYTYDDNGNILTVSDGTYTTTYTYDTANQLKQEVNEKAKKTWSWTYDNAGNITSRTETNHNTNETTTVAYTYGDSAWGDLLTTYNGNTITHDEVGNMLSDGTWTYTWEHGRQLASMTDGTNTWTFTYDANGMRTGRTNGSTTYSYVYNGDQLSQLTALVDGETYVFVFNYDASGIPVSFVLNGSQYYYVTNLQGDVVAVINSSGERVCGYYYTAWNISSLTMGSDPNVGPILVCNPLTYRGYVLDFETGLFYLQSRYYNAAMGRFINADALVSTGQGLLGNNMFAYCRNNPVCRRDIEGTTDVECFDPNGNLLTDDDKSIDGGKMHDASSNAQTAKNGGSVKNPNAGSQNSNSSKIETNNYAGTSGKTEVHHVVEQCQSQKSGFSKSKIQSSSNTVVLDYNLHRQISGFYSSKPAEFGGLRVRDWLAGQSFEAQTAFGWQVINMHYYQQCI